MHEYRDKADAALSGFELLQRLVVAETGMLKDAAVTSSIEGKTKVAPGENLRWTLMTSIDFVCE